MNNSVQELDVAALNNELPPLRCYHCNKLISMFHNSAKSVEKDKLNDYFKENNILRYCCKMILIQSNRN